MKVAVIGGGAAGFFSAISAKENHPDSEVIIFEKSQKVLSKVKVSGGGRCNVTNGTTSISELAKGYPRGEKQLKKAFSVFNTTHTRTWFETRGVPLYIQDDNRVFPTSNNSQTIIDCLFRETERLGIALKLGAGIAAIEPLSGKLELINSSDRDKSPVSFLDTPFERGCRNLLNSSEDEWPDQFMPTGNETGSNGLRLHFSGETTPQTFDKVIIATGGSPTAKSYEWLRNLGHTIEEPAPSLFTFNMPSEPVKELMGVVVENTLVSVQGTKLRSNGPLLVTHWGMSGPAILKLSAFGARILSRMNYAFTISVNWSGEINNEWVMNELTEIIDAHPKKLISNVKPCALPERMWLFLLDKCSVSGNKKWSELSKKELNKLVNTLTNDEYRVQGKTTFKEEFVTCGGVSLESVNFNTMESRVCSGLYFAGEVLDVDGITGGYNFQAAWTTGFIAGKLN